jgi:hypothetical protein
MSEKIVFNGREYDGADAMPPEVRQQYEAVLSLVRAQTGGGKLDWLLESGTVKKLFKITTTVHRRIVVNGKEFDSVDEMPTEVRAAHERALAQAGGAATPTDQRASSPPPTFRPPPVLEEDDRASGLRRIFGWVVLALLVALWLFRKSITGQ